ncbi:MAG: ATP-binding protein, partial [Culicoidibacterales bacterium]
VEKYAFDEFKEQATKFIDFLTHTYDNVYSKKAYYIYFIEKREPLSKIAVNIFSKTVNKLTQHMDAKNIEKIIKTAKITAKNIQKALNKSGLATSPTSFEKTNYIFGRTEIPIKDIERVKEIPILHPHSGADYMMLEYMDNTGEKQTSYVRLLHAKSNSCIVGTSNMADLLSSEIDVSIFVKFDLIHSEKFIKEANERFEDLKQKQKKFFESYDEHNSTLEEQIETVQSLSEHVKATRETQVNYTLTLRIEARTIFELNEQTEKLETRMNNIGIEFNKLSYRQKVGLDHIHPASDNKLKYLKANIEAFCALSLFSGEELGDKMGYPVLQNFYSGQPVLEYSKNIITGKTENKAKENAITSLYIGETGSGKSFLMFVLSIYRLVFEGRPQIKITPKNDEKNVGISATWLKDEFKVINFGTRAIDIGAMDAFIMYNDDAKMAKEVARLDIQAMLDATSTRHHYDLKYLDRAYEACLMAGDRLHMTNMLKWMSKSQDMIAQGMAENLNGIKQTRQGSLFFGDDNTEVAIDYKSKYLVLNLFGISTIKKEEFNRQNIEHVLSERILVRCDKVVAEWDNYWSGVGDILVDEMRVISSYPAASTMVNSWNVMMRSRKKFLHLALQNITQLFGGCEDVLNNYAIAYVGATKSSDERYQLEKNLRLPKVLINDLEARASVVKGYEIKEEIFPFVYSDYTGRFGTVEVLVPEKGLADDYNSRDEG